MSDIFKNVKEIKKEFITVQFLYQECKDRFSIEKISSSEIDTEKKIFEKDIHRPGLALAGYVSLFTFNRVQIFGNTEIRYLTELSKGRRYEVINTLFAFDIPCVVICDNNEIPEELLELANLKNIPLFRTPYPTTRFAYFISDFLDDQFATQIAMHASFVDVYGVGLLICGKSGIGKSEVALDLVERGHRLVADDIVIISKKGEGVLMGSGTSLVKHFMEIRGLGIIDVRKIFGIRAIRYQKRVEVIIILDIWEPGKELNPDRTGLEGSKSNVLGVDIETINLHIFPGKNITVISEVIALNYLLKHYGYNAAKIFEKRLNDKISSNKLNKRDTFEMNKIDRNIEYFEHDFE